MVTGMVSRWRKGKEISNIISILKEKFDCDYYYDLLEAVEKCIEERDYYKKMSFKFMNDLNSFKAELIRKKVHKGHYLKIRDRKNLYNPDCTGGLCFDKSLIGTKVIVWRK